MSYRTLSGLMLAAAFGLVIARSSAAEEKAPKLKLADCPVVVQKTLQREANGAAIGEVAKEVEGEKTIYEIAVKIDGKSYEVTVAENGTLLEKALDEGDDDEEEKDKEEEIKSSACPAAVQKTMKREANGARIDLVDKELHGEKTIYEVDVKIDGKNYEIKVASDGTLISKILDEDDESEDK
jgi:uncharacterized membrane protein YkoI